MLTRYGSRRVRGSNQHWTCSGWPILAGIVRPLAGPVVAAITVVMHLRNDIGTTLSYNRRINH